MVENIIGQDLTTLYRGEPTPFSGLGRTENNMLKGRFFSPDSELARGFAQRPGGVIRSMDVTPNQLIDTQKFKSGLKYKKGFDWLNPNKDVVVASKKLLSEAKPSINWGQTLKHNVDVSKLIAETYGKQGLGFLKNYGLKGLQILGGLPAQVGLMTLSPTMMGNAELLQMPQGSPTQINQGGGDGGYQGGGGKPGSMPTGTAGRNPWGRADGGLINLYRYGGFI